MRSTVLSVLLLSITTLLPAQTTGDFATLVYLANDCGAGGEVIFELNGNVNQYTYYWDHGPTDLHLTGLPPGLYVLTVENFFGCEEIYKVNIDVATTCYLDVFDNPHAAECLKYIQLTLYDAATSLPYDENEVSIEWSDGAEEGMNRFFDQGLVSYQVCATVSLNASNGDCCVIEQCLTIPGNTKCGLQNEPKIIVNEMSAGDGTEAQYVELLVLGNQVCEDSTDIRGYMVDDNNGLLIPGNEIVTESTAGEIGVHMGYIVFNYHDNWKAVPNGSLILMYDDRGTLPSNMPTEDPTDADGDGAYVIPAYNTQYLIAKMGAWNQDEIKLEYTGGYTAPLWDYLQMSANADGMQVRKPDGEYSHGISLGTSPYSATNDFPLWLSDTTATNAICHFVQTDYLDKTHFSCNTLTGSPGVGNNHFNDALIYDLSTCPSLPMQAQVGEQDREETKEPITQVARSGLQVYPNPFREELNLYFQSDRRGQAALQLWSPDGKDILSRQINTVKGSNRYRLTLPGPLPSGVYLLRFTYPSGKVAYERVSSVRL